MVTDIWVNLGSGNGLMPDGTKPLPEAMLINHEWGPVAKAKFHREWANADLLSIDPLGKYFSEIIIKI